MLSSSWRWLILGCWTALLTMTQAVVAQPFILQPDSYRYLIDQFALEDSSEVVNSVSNAQAWPWMLENIPWLDCPDQQLSKVYYFRWWSYRKHIKQTSNGMVLTEFLLPVSHAGPHNTISCALGHHLAEGRWLRERKLLDEYTRFWYRSGPERTRAKHFHKFSSWAAAAIYDRFLVTGDQEFCIDLLIDLVDDYRAWELERGLPSGLFWQHDVKDGMEESICGDRYQKNVRPTINCYMAANARAISAIARMAGQTQLASDFEQKSIELTRLIQAELWDDQAKFYKVKLESGRWCSAREAIGFIPWMYDLADSQQAVAWRQLKDPDGFSAPWGMTTAERRHPLFRTHGTGRCEWDGPVWPFATSQTLTALAKHLRSSTTAESPLSGLNKSDYLDQLQRYASSHQLSGQIYLGEYLDEQTGQWLIRSSKADRSRYYNHSTFADLVIFGLIGIVPCQGNQIILHPLIPEQTWEWFCLDGVPYHGQSVTILWDRDGTHYQRGSGLTVFINGQPIANRPDLTFMEMEID